MSEEQKCVPPELKGIVDQKSEIEDSLVGGWTKNDMSVMSTIEKDKYISWIKEVIRVSRIYSDARDLITINDVYTQVVNGIKYLIYFNLGKASYWTEIYESLPDFTSASNGYTTLHKISVLRVIPCSMVQTPSYFTPSTSNPFYSISRLLYRV
jgi:hypothetical protein